MCTIKLNEIIKDRTYPEAGEYLFDLIEKTMASEDKINLDLSEVVSLPSMFLNVSIGRFIEKYGYDKLKNTITFSKISSTQADRISKYVTNFAKK